jgi:hypothetical protein
MPLDKSFLLDFIKILDAHIQGKITIVAVGGTAMALLDTKLSTIDIDFTIPSRDRAMFEVALAAEPHGFKVDVWTDGTVFCVTLPNDYLHNSRVTFDFPHILLKALDPVDIIVTKIARLDDRDMQDIKACIDKFGISKRQIEDRWAAVQYAGKEEFYRYNLKCVLREFFD